MSLTLSLHDSEIREVHAHGERRDAALTLHFSAAHVHDAESGVAGYAQTLRLTFHGAVWTGAIADAIGRLAGGDLTIGAVPHAIGPLPFRGAGDVRARFVFNNGTVLQVTAASVDCGFAGDPRFVESYAC